MNTKGIILGVVAVLGLCVIIALMNNSDSRVQDVKNGYAITEIDGCEYILYKEYSQIALAHKGNCKNLIHKQ